MKTDDYVQKSPSPFCERFFPSGLLTPTSDSALDSRYGFHFPPSPRNAFNDETEHTSPVSLHNGSQDSSSEGLETDFLWNDFGFLEAQDFSASSDSICTMSSSNQENGVLASTATTKLASQVLTAIPDEAHLDSIYASENDSLAPSALSENLPWQQHNDRICDQSANICFASTDLLYQYYNSNHHHLAQQPKQYQEQHYYAPQSHEIPQTATIKSLGLSEAESTEITPSPTKPSPPTESFELMTTLKLSSLGRTGDFSEEQLSNMCENLQHTVDLPGDPFHMFLTEEGLGPLPTLQLTSTTAQSQLNQPGMEMPHGPPHLNEGVPLDFQAHQVFLERYNLSHAHPQSSIQTLEDYQLNCRLGWGDSNPTSHPSAHNNQYHHLHLQHQCWPQLEPQSYIDLGYHLDYPSYYPLLPTSLPSHRTRQYRSHPIFVTSPSESFLKRRRRLAPEESEFLHCQFQINERPNAQERESIANHLKLDKRTIQVWFQNRRAKLKRDERGEGDGCQYEEQDDDEEEFEQTELISRVLGDEGNMDEVTVKIEEMPSNVHTELGGLLNGHE
ncbi:hypothetical protein BGZ46_006073 [Entomortierella lignicola]|nr:hypothetical protein BGZ46_006073 [Entomortierella lignicola]